MKNNQLFPFERIIRGKLRPWLGKNRHEEKFVQNIRKIEIIEPQFQPFYEIDFYRYFNCKTKYYHKLILSESNNYCNRIIEMIGREEDPGNKKYRVSRSLNKVKMLLRETAGIIHSQNYILIHIRADLTQREIISRIPMLSSF